MTLQSTEVVQFLKTAFRAKNLDESQLIILTAYESVTILNYSVTGVQWDKH